MPDDEVERQSAHIEPELRDMKIEEGGEWEGAGAQFSSRSREGSSTPQRTASPAPVAVKARSASHSPVKKQHPSQSPSDTTSEHEEIIGGEITVKMEPGKAPKLARTAPHKVVARAPPLFHHLPDATDEAKRSFQVITDCSYSSKYIGNTEHALECDCSEEWDQATGINDACGEDSDCINRATKMECIGDCGCGAACQNQRFQLKQYAKVTVIKTEKKGYGLRADTDMRAGEFIFEYIGEVINEQHFRRRMIQYDEEGIKHFYFMSLSKGEFVDATKKGNLGRFCNHSCNPNCFVDKWVIGEKLRMGIFAERNIKAGEELVFNYNVDRYGADPQPCYCGEPNCSGYIGGKTQTERATKLSHITIEALGIDDGDGWDVAVAKKPRKKKSGEDDEEYVNNVQPKSLEEGGVTKVMATLMQCKEKWIAVKLLSRIQRSDDEKVGHRVIRMHGYTILKKTLAEWAGDFNVVLQVLDILEKLPRITRNKIQDSKIEETMEQFKTCEDERVQTKACALLETWSKLAVGYRIPRMKRDPNAEAPVRADRSERRERARERSKSKTKSPEPAIDAPKGPSVPAGPRAGLPPRNPAFFGGPRAFRRAPPFNPLPMGWFQATAENGTVYYYSANGQTQWQRPTTAASQPPPPPPKEKTHQQKLEDIIASITQDASRNSDVSASATPQPASHSSEKEKKTKSEKWRSLSEEKQQKIYENTLFPHIKSVTDHYRKKLEKDDLKRLAKEVAKKLVRGDYKSGRVQDPTTKLSHRHEKSVKVFVKAFMDKAVQKKVDREKERAARAERKKASSAAGQKASPDAPTPKIHAQEESDNEMMGILDDDGERAMDISPSSSSSDLKRKRGESDPQADDDEQASLKKFRTETPPVPAPPPPPPPPAEDMPTEMDADDYGGTNDGSESFDSEAVGSAMGQSSLGKPPQPSELVTDRIKQSDERMNGRHSPMQLATPPTTTNGSCEHESNGKDREAASIE
ncbi:uncharacterized protein BDZ99DRAFT_281967 [Mytilinidion resinicola]|uniref:Histone-lysine N-methyltransferase, H3 lysine-36 specific n=1 Tax=Mytilinidion resinicola TaxID=574789 RepID=A0A6A6YSS6_9PEZI|nr:uncharacterized protein BDZ99DRAFT_281967 [Mytilinidion resinicola]KAF2811860.1 hypothetical protein BDZ99DRAFT_281967 [Mytilinidion resinicola]